METDSQRDILLVEDNPGDARLVAEAFKDNDICGTIHHVCDGETALDFLYQRGAYIGVKRPDIVLLDLNLPRVKGQEVLAQIKAEESLKCIPVVALTTSKDKRDIDTCYGLGAAAYIVKPVGFDDFADAIDTFKKFWLSSVTLPEPLI